LRVLKPMGRIIYTYETKNKRPPSNQIDNALQISI
jgi:hypothetical protein